MTTKLPTAIVVDNFYDNPQEIVTLAQSLTYQKSPQTNYPGERTEDLLLVSPEFYLSSRRIFLEYFLAYDKGAVDNWIVTTRFQRIPANVTKAELNEGWIHSDSCEDIAGVVYLNEKILQSSGTVLACPNEGLKPQVNANIDYRNAYYGGRNGITDEDFIRAKNIHNAKFNDDVSVKNQFNRMFAFNCKLPHKQNGFGSLDDHRLTQVFFIKRKVIYF